MKEQQPSSLDGLLAKQAKLSQIVDQRQKLLKSLEEKLGQGGIENLVIDSKIDDIIRPKVEASFERVKASLVQTEATIADQTEPLISQAQQYIDNLALYQQTLIKLKEKDTFPKERLARREAQLQELREKAETDPVLKLGIKLLREREEKEKAAKAVETQPAVQVATPIIEEEKSLVLPDGSQPIGLIEKEKIVLEGLLCGSEEKPISGSELAKYVYGVNLPIATAKKRLHIRLTHLKRKLAPLKWQVVNKTLQGARFKREEALYYLASIEEEVKVEEEPKLVIFEDQNLIEFDGSRIELRRKALRVLQVLANNINKQVFSSTLSLESLGDANTGRTHLNHVVDSLKTKINPPEGGENYLISSGRKAQHSWYMLRGVEVIWEPKRQPREELEELAQGGFLAEDEIPEG